MNSQTGFSGFRVVSMPLVVALTVLSWSCGGPGLEYEKTSLDIHGEEWAAGTGVERFNPLQGEFQATVLGEIVPGDEFKAGDRFYQTAGEGTVVYRADITPGHLEMLHRPYDARYSIMPTREDVVWVIESDSGGEDPGHYFLGHIQGNATLVFQGKEYRFDHKDVGNALLRESGRVLRKVKETFLRPPNRIWELDLVSAKGVEFSVSGTGDHPVYVPDLDAYVPMQDLQRGWAVRGGDGEPVVVRWVRDANRVAETFNFEVENDPNYFVAQGGVSEGWLSDGFLVHNGNCWKDKVMKHLGLDDVPQWMKKYNPHGHHIVPQKGGGKIGAELRELARKNGIGDHINDMDNLTLAPNGLGTHKQVQGGLEKVLNELKGVDGKGGAAFRRKLKKIGERMRNGDFYREMGVKIDG